MGSITSGVGLISGINSGQIIDQLISLDARPRTLLQNRISTNNNIKLAYSQLQAQLTALQGTANLLVKPSTFSGATGTSSDPNTLGVTVTPSAAAGQYQFTVARTVTSQSGISAGFADSSSALVGAGIIRIGVGGGEVTTTPQLSELNSGNGVRRGTFRITDKSGSSAAVDISTAISLDDVVKKINNASNLQVKASIGDNGLVIEDSSGGTGTIRVTEVGGGNTAADLGILGTEAGATLTGASINKIGRGSLLSSLNDGLGVRNKPGNVDLKITTADGTSKDITLTGKKTVGEVIDTLNSASAGKYSVALRSDGKGLKVTDLSTPNGTDTFSIAGQNGSKAAADLGIEGTSAGTEITGSSVRGSLGSVLLKSINGGSGLGTGTLELTDRAGTTASLDLSGASSLSDLITSINNAGTGLRAALNKSGTGLALTDTTSGTGNITIASSSGGTVAESLNLAGTYGTGTSTIDSGSLKRKYISEGTQLATLNGGKGISSGKFSIKNAFGQTAEVDTSLFTNGTVQDVISAINAKNIGVVASINAEGSGLLLTDNSTRPSGSTVTEGKLTVTDSSGTAASDLGINGTATAKTLDGAQTTSIEVTATDTLESVLKKINAASAGVTAAIVNDGSGASPFRLSVNASGSGLNGRFTFDAGTTGLGLDTLVKPQNAAVFLGSATSSAPILISSSSNTISNVVPGVSLSLLGASDRPVTVSVSQTADAAVTQLKSFVTSFNGLTSKVAEFTKFDSTTNAKGILLGDATAASITDTLFRSVSATISGAGRYNRLSQVGVSIGEKNQISFDEDKFRAAYTADPTATQRLFTAFNTVTTTSTTDKTTKKVTDAVVTTPFGTEASGVKTGTDTGGNKFTATTKLEGFGLGYTIQKALTKLIDPTDGAIIKQNKSIDDANKLFQDRITNLTSLLDAKKARLTKQFANMETVLSQLQNQQSSISKISNVNSSSSN